MNKKWITCPRLCRVDTESSPKKLFGQIFKIFARKGKLSFYNTILQKMDGICHSKEMKLLTFIKSFCLLESFTLLFNMKLKCILGFLIVGAGWFIGPQEIRFIQWTDMAIEILWGVQTMMCGWNAIHVTVQCCLFFHWTCCSELILIWGLTMNLCATTVWSTQ